MQFPLGIVESVELNDLGEVVSATVRKGNTKIVRKHVNDLILLLKANTPFTETDCNEALTLQDKPHLNKRIQPHRQAKIEAKKKLAISDQ